MTLHWATHLSFLENGKSSNRARRVSYLAALKGSEKPDAVKSS
jgi:hypothetical protein